MASVEMRKSAVRLTSRRRFPLTSSLYSTGAAASRRFAAAATCSAPWRRSAFVDSPSRSAWKPAASAKRRGCGPNARTSATRSARGTSGRWFDSVTVFVAVKVSVSVPSPPLATANTPFTPPYVSHESRLFAFNVESVVPGARTSA